MTVSGRAEKGACAMSGAQPLHSAAPSINRMVVGLMANLGLGMLMIWEEAAPLFSPGQGRRKGAVSSNLV